MDIIRNNRTFWLYLVGIVLLFIILLVLASIFLTQDGVDLGNTDDDDTEVPLTFDSIPEYRLEPDSIYFADFQTSMGNFRVELFPLSAPANVNSFVFLAQRNYYNGTKFHRVEPGVLIQGGSRLTINEDPADDNLGNPGYVVVDEINWDSLDFTSSKRESLEQEGYKSNPDVGSIQMKRYSLVMANANTPNTAGSQFFIVFADNADPRLQYLTGRHTVIGQVIEGSDVVDEMRKIDVDTSDLENPRPVLDILITGVTIVVED